jgi:hypothetical protein
VGCLLFLPRCGGSSRITAMDGYYIRFFSLTPIATIARLQLWLAEREYTVRPAGTNALDVWAGQDGEPLRVELTTAHEQLTQQDIIAFIEAVNQRPDPNAGLVLSVLARTQTVIALYMIAGVDEGLVPDVLDGCYALGQGMVQVDGEGFYDGGVLILEVD